MHNVVMRAQTGAVAVLGDGGWRAECKRARRYTALLSLRHEGAGHREAVRGRRGPANAVVEDVCEGGSLKMSRASGRVDQPRCGTVLES
jgi:hypothetical protein